MIYSNVNMITILLKKSNNYRQIWKSSLEHWSQFGKVIPCENYSDVVDKVKTQYYVQADSAWVLTELAEIPETPCQITFVESIEMHRLDRVKCLKQLVHETNNPNVPTIKIDGKLYNTIGKVCKSLELPSFAISYERFWYKLTLHGQLEWEKFDEYKLSEMQVLSLCERFAIFNHTVDKQQEIKLEHCIQNLKTPYSSLIKSYRLLQKNQIDEAKKELKNYIQLPPLKPDSNYFYDIYIRDFLVHSLQLRFAILDNDTEQMIANARKFFASNPSFREYKIHIHLLKIYCKQRGIKYENIEQLSQQSTTHFSPFVVLSQPRCGSTLLTKDLNNHHEISCLGELLAGEEILREINQKEKQLEFILKRELDAAKLLKEILTYGKKEKRGVKIIGSQLYGYLDQDKLWEKLMLQTNKLIVIHRKADEKRANSLSRASINENYRAHKYFSLYDIPQNSEKYLEIIQNQEQQTSKLIYIAKSLGIEILEVDYEQYVSDKVIEQRKICTFLGVTYQPMSSTLKKQNIWK
jgi:LPS sulfotransferase NodH